LGSDLPIPGLVEFKYEEMKEHSHPFYLILDQKGLRFEPAPPPSSFDAFFLSSRKRPTFEEEAELFGNLEKKAKHEVVFRVLRIIEPRLKRLTMIYAAGQPVLHGDLGFGQPLPLPMMGEGMVRLASIVVRLGNASGGVALIDEIENGLHHSVIKKIWEALGEASRLFNTQIFATTHSRECIIAAHEAFSGARSDDFRFHRLDRINGEIRAVSYDRDSLEASLDMNLEVR
jgi:hypothetical protein